VLTLLQLPGEVSIQARAPITDSDSYGYIEMSSAEELTLREFSCYIIVSHGV